ncbi:DUF6686 family protein [Algibacter sp. PT7-4]|uniref:DUF6686 family protein n=1 Tax=Algibacter ulvanivorans TaxID=3400999 RepID=UPI003AAD174E
MNHKYKTLAKNCYGQLTYCINCKIYHLTFNNIYLEFNENEMVRFKEYILELEADYWQIPNDAFIMNRKFPIKTMQQNLSLIFNKQELRAIKNLITRFNKSNTETLRVYDIDYLFYLN